MQSSTLSVPPKRVYSPYYSSFDNTSSYRKMKTIMTTTDKSSEQRQGFKPTRRQIITGLVVVVSLFAVYEIGRYAHLWGEPNELRAIKSEKLASEELLGLTLVESRQRGEGDLASKTVSPGIERTFKLTGESVKDLQARIIEYAKNEGWEEATGYVPEGSWEGRKSVKGFGLFISIKSSPNHDNAVKVEIF